MSKPKRTEVRSASEKPVHPPAHARADPDAHFRDIIRGVTKAAGEYARTVQLVYQLARRAGKQGHPIEAAMFNRIATLLSKPELLDEGDRNMELVCKLLAWLPLPHELSGYSTKERKAWKAVLFLKLRIDPTTRAQLDDEATKKARRPPSTRLFAVRAMELYKKRKDWDLIAKSLPCDWTMVENPGESIRRQVQFLEGILKECGVKLKTL